MRYFIEISYKGTAYSGFQVQQNSNTIQAEIEKALSVFFKQSFTLTGSSRTDAGVHALQNYFHFDVEKELAHDLKTERSSRLSGLEKSTYHLNAILPPDIVIRRIFRVADAAHCRFDAVSREYQYFIYKSKDPFLEDRAYYFPYNTDIGKLKECADIILLHKDFTSFSKRNTQVHNFICDIQNSEWTEGKNTLIYSVKSNRFLRGMVKALVGTMLRVATQKISVDEFKNIIESRNCTGADFSIPSHGLFLVKVAYPDF
ncbi:MAG: tRNA pseudouridine(38-40) synthase TruA [Bacteroidota bacterium]|nr:tRNA pseudouridine(38-40) synthase TruA [Bacteroidota bacterium]